MVLLNKIPVIFLKAGMQLLIKHLTLSDAVVSDRPSDKRHGVLKMVLSDFCEGEGNMINIA